jgi:uncharacterized protein YjbJ (UPF0337 family)
MTGARIGDHPDPHPARRLLPSSGDEGRIDRSGTVLIPRRSERMNRNEMKGNWRQLKGHVQEKWGELTDDDLDEIEGRREILVGKVQERYGKTQAEASEEVDDWFDHMAG